MSNPVNPSDTGSDIPPAQPAAPAAYDPPAAPAYETAAPPAYAQAPAPPYPREPQAYGYPQPGQPYLPAPQQPDTRPKGLAVTALILAVAGLVLAAVGFAPLPGVSLAFAIGGGLLLLAALVLSIIVLVARKFGGKALGVAALVVAVVGGILAIFALVASLVWIGLANGLGSAPGSDPGTVQPAGEYDEAAFLTEVRPQIVAIMQSIEPSLTEEQVTQVYTDDMLLTIGKTFVTLTGAGREAARTSFISSTVDSSGGVFTDETAAQFFDAIVNAADKHLVQ